MHNILIFTGSTIYKYDEITINVYFNFNSYNQSMYMFPLQVGTR